MHSAWQIEYEIAGAGSDALDCFRCTRHPVSVTVLERMLLTELV